mmetsp:Transcript_37818/g.108075  ORF Transcript_37818/g.108075 Transcript_37818/m.108075 type:complete len:129 (+) Transcript_37818:209-595(+)
MQRHVDTSVTVEEVQVLWKQRRIDGSTTGRRIDDLLKALENHFVQLIDDLAGQAREAPQQQQMGSDWWADGRTAALKQHIHCATERIRGEMCLVELSQGNMEGSLPLLLEWLKNPSSQQQLKRLTAGS